ncbi:MAG: hypothetical protein E6H06_21010 [Bacteroidetes bacterium]|nr:MAG: hypothetical protein E6H06_21010 [Bacteroidota bacterium]
MKATKLVSNLIPIFFSFFILLGEGQKVEKLTFRYGNFNIETSSRVSCDNFENFFSGSYKTVVIKDNNTLKEFADDLSHCKVSDSTKKIDVRLKVIITYHKKNNAVLCMDRFDNLILNNRSIIANQEILSFLRKQINK